MPEPPAGERRAAPREPCDPEARVRAGEFYEGSPRWGRVLDASSDGLGLLLPAPFCRGALLVVGIHAPGLPQPYLALARVAHATPQPDGNYRVGCALNAPLPALILEALTVGRAVTAGPAGELLASCR